MAHQPQERQPQSGGAAAAAAPAISRLPKFPIGKHGELRGLESSPRSSSFEGRFGRMFRDLPAAEFNEDLLKQLGAAMTADADEPPTPETEVDSEENTGISAGYTYFGQFIDHDLTFDPSSSLDRQNDPNALVDFRTPRFDLDCVYGRGPDDQPYLYRKDGIHFLLGSALTGNPADPNASGVPRNRAVAGEPERALIGDPRNDENVIVSQFQAHMLRFHNRMADEMRGSSFAEVQQQVRWHYQWCVLNDFLPTIIREDLAKDILGVKKIGDVPNPKLKLYAARRSAYMPVEFAVAAYRFGHSMIRPIYRLNQNIDRLRIFSKDKPSLVGFDAFPENWAIDWKLFFPNVDAKPLSPSRVQPAYKIDTSLVNPLGDLPAVIVPPPTSLAARNLLRSWRMGMPSGQAVARAMGEKVIDDKDLRVGKADEDGLKNNKPLFESFKGAEKFKNNAPLWFYILSEAQQNIQNNATPVHLGRVGGRIVGEVFVGLMMADGSSYVNAHPNFRPNEKFKQGNDFKILQLLLAAEQPAKEAARA